MKVQPGVPTTFPVMTKRSGVRQEGASHHGVGTNSGIHPEDRPHTTNERRQQGRNAYTPVTSDVEDDDEFYETRVPSSVRRYRAPIAPTQITVHRIPARSSSTTQQRPVPQVQSVQQGYRQPQRLHWTVYVGLALLFMLVGWIGLSALGSWWQTTSDDWHYGRPRTFQLDAVVGHSDSASNPSHFVALNLNRHVEIIELSGGDVTKAHIYTGPTLIGDRQELAPVTLSFHDVTGDGKPDMIIAVGESRYVYVNDNAAFRPAKPGEVTSNV